MTTDFHQCFAAKNIVSYIMLPSRTGLDVARVQMDARSVLQHAQAVLYNLAFNLVLTEYQHLYFNYDKLPKGINTKIERKSVIKQFLKIRLKIVRVILQMY